MTGLLTLIVLLISARQTSASCDPGQVESKGFLGISWFSKCQDCEIGTYQSGKECKKCDPGYYSNLPKQTKCSPCLRGTFAENPGSTNCTKCPAGEFSTTAASSCIRCPPGSYSGSPGAATCEACPGGSYSEKEGSEGCTKCDDGMTSPAGSTSSGNCTGSCSAGYLHTVHNKTVKCEECTAGTFSLQGALECTNCSAGEFSVPGSGSCSLCLPGTFSNTPRSAACLTCPPGSVTNTTGSVNCTLCPQNTFNNEDNTLCVPCSSGSYSQPGSSKCEPCSAGYYHNTTTNLCVECENSSTPPDICSQFLMHKLPFSTPTSTPPDVAVHPALGRRLIAAIVLSFMGIAIILAVTVYAVCWTRCKLQNIYKFGPTPKSEAGVELADSIANSGTLNYSSCSEVKPEVQTDLQEENIYDIPVNPEKR